MIEAITLAAGVTAMYNARTVDETDQRDIAAARTGDEGAFARLVRRHQAAVAGLLWRFTREPAQLEDLLVETTWKFPPAALELIRGLIDDYRSGRFMP